MSDISIRDYSSVASSGIRKIILDSVMSTLSDLDPARITKNFLENSPLHAGNDARLHVFGFGKASIGMVEGVKAFLGNLPEGTAVIVPKGLEVPREFSGATVLRGSHPVLDDDSVKSTSAILSRLTDLGTEDQVIVLISGGGSALFELPIQGLSAADIGRISKCVMNNGADIVELNSIRQALSQVKGGKLAAKLYPASVTSLIISDVPGDDPSIIASGPLVPPSVPEEQRKKIIDKYSVTCSDLSRYRSRLDMKMPMADDMIFKHVSNSIILKNMDFVERIASYLMKSGTAVKVLRQPIVGDVADAAAMIRREALQFYSQTGEPVFLVGGGETTVKVRGNGIGGRNTEMAIRVAQYFGPGHNFTFASLGTDGIDGVSPAMGGITDRAFLQDAMPLIPDYLERSDSYTLLDRFNSAVVTGFTGNNVSDVFVCHYGGKVA